MSNDDTSIRVFKKRAAFAAVPKEALSDKRLSFKAKGIFSYLMGKPDGWVAQVADLMNQSTDGRDSVYTGIKELRMNGYAKLERITEAGKVKKWALHVFDIPDTGFPDVEKPDLEKPHLSKNREEARMNGVDSLQLGEIDDIKPPEVEDVVEAWNDQIALPKIKAVDGRMRAIKRRLRSPFFRANYRAGIATVARSKFCRGAGSEGWRANIDWFLREGTLEKVLEGKYDDRNSPKTPLPHERTYEDETL